MSQRLDIPPDRCIVLVMTKSIRFATTIAIVLALLGGCKPVSGTPQPTPAASTIKGDDDHDGSIDEDESGWNCKTMGNKTCSDVDKKK